MKKLLIIIIILVCFGIWFSQRENISLEKDMLNPVEGKKLLNQQEEKFIFVPYWTFSDELDVNEYGSLIYFGVSIDENGIDKNEEGYRKMDSFVRFAPSDKKKYLTLRLVNSEINEKIIEDDTFQRKVASQLADLANSHEFDGVVIDYETSAFGFESVENEITDMYKVFNSEVKRKDLELLVTVFGDTYYRARPYNIGEIGKLSDGVIVMAYDFHKARLNPGPTFSLSDDDKYGYSLLSMVDDFSEDVPGEKIIITLGYFGYDWKLSDDRTSMGMAEPLTTNQFESRFLAGCDFDNCRINKNNDGESSVLYEDEEGYNHEVWSEDMDSIDRKITALNDKGVRRIGIWAYSFY